MKTVKRKTAKVSVMRSLKINSRYRSNRYENKLIPEITLRGNWLEQAGFLREQRVSVATLNGLLIIKKEE
jgi:hypothetical protein